MKTATILLTFRDDNLSQRDWANCFDTINRGVYHLTERRLFCGGDDVTGLPRKAVWVALLFDEWLRSLEGALQDIRKEYPQATVMLFVAEVKDAEACKRLLSGSETRTTS